MSVQTVRSEWLAALAASLRGSRRAKRRLILELEGHLEDAIAAEIRAGTEPHAAETAAVDRLGSASDIAARWNADAHRRRWQVRGKVLASALAVAAVVAPVGLAQVPTHKPKPHTARTDASGTSSRQAPRASPSHLVSAGRGR
jgi:hypothetical protein